MLLFINFQTTIWQESWKIDKKKRKKLLDSELQLFTCITEQTKMGLVVECY